MPAKTTWDTPSPDAAPMEAGPRYVVRGELGRGGMGRVLLAWDRLLDREVAIKEVSIAASPAAVARLVAEARLTARLEHPAIIPVHDAGEGPDGTLFYVMKRVEGESLEQAIAACASIADRLALLDRVIAVGNAVAHAHARGVLHRDLKPANVMLGPRGETLLVDWGIALHLAAPTAGLAGTPGFMSPEQCREEPLDVRSDVWGLGAILHQLLTGHPPAAGPDPMAQVHRVATLPLPPVRADHPEVPAPLAAIVDRALAFSREGRYPSADAVVADLEAWRAGLAVSAYHYRPGEAVARLARRYRLPLGALALGLALAVVASVTGFLRVRAERDVAEAALAAALEQQAAIADRSGDAVGALAYAAAALSRGERPLARGLVVRHLGTVPYRLAETTAVGGCLFLTEHTCVRATEVVDRAQTWRVPLPAPAVAAEEGAAGLVVASTHEVWRVDPATGATVARLDAANVANVWVHPTDPERMAWAEGRRLVRLDHGARTEREYASFLKAVAWRGDRVVLATASGEVWADADAEAPVCLERRGLVTADFDRAGEGVIGVTFSGTLVDLDGATCVPRLPGAVDVPAGGRVRPIEGGGYAGRVADGTVRVWDADGAEVVRLPRAPGWDHAVRPTATGFEVATRALVLRYEPAPARLGVVPGAPRKTALAVADDDTWLVGDELGVARWGWDRRRHWAQDTGPVRGLAWAAGQAWVLSDANVLPFAADGTPLPPREAPLVRGIQADWARRAVLLGGAVEQAVLRPDELRPVPGPGSDGRMTRGADGWLIPEEAGGWSRVALDGTRTATDAPRDAYWYGESPDGRHRAWIDSAGVAWIDGAPVVSSGERRLWVEWVAEDRWLVTSRIDTAIVDHRGTTLLRRELVRGRLLDLAAAGDHLLVFGPDQRVEAWDLGALSTTADAILTTLGRDLGVEVVGSEVRLLGA